MLCADVSHKIMRSDTVYDTLNEIYEYSRNFHEDAVKTLVGEIVLTRSVCHCLELWGLVLVG